MSSDLRRMHIEKMRKEANEYSRAKWFWLVLTGIVYYFFEWWALIPAMLVIFALVKSMAAKKSAEPYEIGSEEDKNIVSDFGSLMESKPDLMTSFYDTKVLPHKKEKIVTALFNLHDMTFDQIRKDQLKVGLLAISRFQDGVGENPISEIPDIPAAHGDLSEMAETIVNNAKAIDEDLLNHLKEVSKKEYDSFTEKLSFHQKIMGTMS